MSYSIRYGSEKLRVERQTSGKSHDLFRIMAFVLVVAGLFWPQGVESIRLALCPWLDQGLVLRWNAMVAQIRDGTGVVQALAVFCQEVIRNAGILV